MNRWVSSLRFWMSLVLFLSPIAHASTTPDGCERAVLGPRFILPYGTTDLFLPEALAIAQVTIRRPIFAGFFEKRPRFETTSVRLVTLRNIRRGFFHFVAQQESPSPFGDLFGSHRRQEYLALSSMPPNPVSALQITYDQRDLMHNPTIRILGIPVDRLEVFANETQIAATSFQVIPSNSTAASGATPNDLFLNTEDAREVQEAYSKFAAAMERSEQESPAMTKMGISISGETPKTLTIRGTITLDAAAFLYGTMIRGNLRPEHPLFSFAPIARIASVLKGLESEIGQDTAPKTPHARRAGEFFYW